MKTKISTLLVLSGNFLFTQTVCATVIFEDGFEAAETLSGNGWSGNWNFSNTKYGNPYNYAWSDGSLGLISKDTGYVINNGDEVILTFDISDMNPTEVGSAAVITTELCYNDGTGDIVLGSLELNDDQIISTTVDGVKSWVKSPTVY